MMPDPSAHDKRSFVPVARDVMLMHMKRTTLQIDPALLIELRKRAAHEGRTLTEVIEPDGAQHGFRWQGAIDGLDIALSVRRSTEPAR